MSPGGPGADSIRAVVYDGVQGFLKHTGGPTGAVDGAALTVAWAGTFNSDGSAMTLVDIPGTVPVKLTRNADNTISFAGGTAGAVFSNSTTAVAASLGFLIVLASCNGTTAHLYVIHAAGLITGTNTPGSATNLDLTADWFFGADGGAAEFLDADTAIWWADDSFIDFSDSDNREQFWDTTNDLLRDPGAAGSNPTDGALSPLVCHKSPAASHTTNVGTGGNADTAGAFTDGTSPGTYAADFSGRTAADVLAEAAGWWEADHASNVHDGSTFSQLTDLSGNGNHFVQATSGNQPARLDTSGVISAEFDGDPLGGDDFMALASPDAALANAHNSGGTTMAVFRTDSRGEGGFARIFDFNDNTERLNVNSPGVPHDEFDVQFVMDMSGSDPNFETAAHIANGTLLLVDIRYDKSSNDDSTAVMGMNGSDLTVGSGLEATGGTSGTPVDHSSNTMYLGNRADGTRCFDGGIYALVRWNSVLSASDIALVRAAWATKYGITLS